MWTAASVLSLRTPKLEFDPAMDLSDISGEDGLSTLEKYVQLLLSRSFEDSSLFWHYAMRHVPSDSLVCASASVPTFAAGSKLQFSVETGLAQQDPALLQQVSLKFWTMCLSVLCVSQICLFCVGDSATCC